MEDAEENIAKEAWKIGISPTMLILKTDIWS